MITDAHTVTRADSSVVTAAERSAAMDLSALLHTGQREIVRGPAEIRHIFSSSAWVDEPAKRQLAQTAKLEGMIVVAGMPDLHAGKNGPVGAAFVTDNTLHPDLVERDIGCGMGAFLTSVYPRGSLEKRVK